MKQFFFSLLTMAAASVVGIAQTQQPPAAAETDSSSIVIPVDSPAFVFSPGNWTGNAARQGSAFRQTWNPGAYFRVHWSSSAQSTATLLLDTSSHDGTFGPPQITYSVDGRWTVGVPSARTIKIERIPDGKDHVLTVYLSTSEQRDRWGAPGVSGKNVLRVTGLKVDAKSKPGTAVSNPNWLLIVGDSITEGSAAGDGKSDCLSAYSHLVGQAMQTQGFEYGISACGWSGWLRRGDNPPGDVPAYYAISESKAGAGGLYDDTNSRWNKLDGNNHSLLDEKGRISGFGSTGQEPVAILINYGTNDDFAKLPPSDVQASVTQSLGALRQAAPEAHIFILVPFEQFSVAPLKSGVNAHQAAHPADKKVTVIDLGKTVGQTLDANDYWGGVHPNARGHAVFAAQVVAAVQAGLLKP